MKRFGMNIPEPLYARMIVRKKQDGDIDMSAFCRRVIMEYLNKQKDDRCETCDANGDICSVYEKSGCRFYKEQNK